MGQRFYTGDVPKIADQLERLKANLEALVAELRKQRTTRAQPAVSVREGSPDPQ